LDKLDSFDISILGQLQKDASQTAATVAEKVCLSSSQCHRRIKRLEEAGYIDKYVALLNPQKFKLNINAIVMIKVYRDTPETKKDFLRFVEESDHILESWTVVGDRYAMLKVVAEDMDSFSKFISNQLMSNSNIASSESILMMENLKITTNIPVK
jgi:DNA-binding Lrp family transcriptional regulator